MECFRICDIDIGADVREICAFSRTSFAVIGGHGTFRLVNAMTGEQHDAAASVGRLRAHEHDEEEALFAAGNMDFLRACMESNKLRGDMVPDPHRYPRGLAHAAVVCARGRKLIAAVDVCANEIIIVDAESKRELSRSGLGLVPVTVPVPVPVSVSVPGPVPVSVPISGPSSQSHSTAGTNTNTNAVDVVFVTDDAGMRPMRSGRLIVALADGSIAVREIKHHTAQIGDPDVIFRLKSPEDRVRFVCTLSNGIMLIGTNDHLLARRTISVGQHETETITEHIYDPVDGVCILGELHVAFWHGANMGMFRFRNDDDSVAPVSIRHVVIEEGPPIDRVIATKRRIIIVKREQVATIFRWEPERFPPLENGWHG